MNGKRLLALVLLGVFLTVTYIGATAEDAKEEFTLMGVKNCKMCHNKEKTGAQFSVWEKGPHAGAYATLATDEAEMPLDAGKTVLVPAGADEYVFKDAQAFACLIAAPPRKAPAR